MSDLKLRWETFRRLTLKQADTFSSALGTQVEVSTPVLHESFERMKVAVRIFGLPNGINYYKEAGTACFWVRKLKPFRVLIPENTSHEDRAKLEVFPINECVALYSGIEIVRYSQKKGLSELSNQVEIDKNIKEMERNYTRLRSMEKDIVNSLRYYIHSWGSLPIIFEAALRIPLDDHFAFHK